MRTWRYIFSPFWSIAFVVIYGLGRWGVVYFHSLGPFVATDDHEARLLLIIDILPGVCLCVAGAVFGAYRGSNFHPRRNKGYAAWLAMTPWRAGVPLPLGPAELTWWDALWVAVVTAVAVFDAGIAWYWVPVVWSVGWIVAAAVVVRRFSAPQWFAAFTLPLLLYPRPTLWVAGSVLIANVALLMWSMRKDLEAFPWDKDTWLADPVEQHREFARRTMLKWPYDRCGPVQPRKKPNRVARVLASLLIGWWLHVLIAAALWHTEFTDGSVDFTNVAWAQFEESLRDGDVALFFILSAFIAVVRLLVYTGGRQPPISLWGRLRTGRWIVPRYDIVWLPPWVILLTGLVLPWAWVTVGGPVQWVPGATVAALFMLALLLGPNLERWNLTGMHHVASSARRGTGVGSATRIEITR